MDATTITIDARPFERYYHLCTLAAAELFNEGFDDARIMFPNDRWLTDAQSIAYNAGFMSGFEHYYPE